jgi:hypothetical protein
MDGCLSDRPVYLRGLAPAGVGVQGLAMAWRRGRLWGLGRGVSGVLEA